jgi:hypothetical protein
LANKTTGQSLGAGSLAIILFNDLKLKKMKKVMAIIVLILSIGLENTYAQEKTMPVDSTLLRDNMRTKMDTMTPPTMDIEPAKRDNTRMDNMPIKRDTTPMEMDKMRKESMPTKVDTISNRKMNQTMNRMNQDSMKNANSNRKRRQDSVLNGMYNGQRIRSDTIRKGMKMENIPQNKVKPKNKKEMDGTQNGKYNYEMSRDSMPNGIYGEKIRRSSTPNTMPTAEEKMRAQMAKEDRGVLMHRGRTMIVRNGQKTFIKSHTHLSYGTKVMSDGTIIKKDGTKTMMKDGEFVNMMGEIVPMKE